MERVKAHRRPCRSGPVHSLVECHLQVHDGALAAAVVELRMIGLVGQVEHDGARAEVERHAVADVESGTTLYWIGQPSLLDRAHADGRSRLRPVLQLRIGPEAAVPDDGRQPVHMDDVIDLPAYPWHSACWDICFQYVLYDGVTVMGFKVASRVRGLGDEAFGEAFGTKEQCRAALVRLRWPGGFVCPWCGHREHCVLAGRGLYQCNRCKKQTSPTAGTIFHATKLPLTLWFAAIHLIVTAKNGISSVELGRRLGVKQPTAWAVKHKIMAVMARREGETALTGRVEMDDAYLGGVRSGGKRGRGAAGKTPFVAAVSTSPEGRPRKLKLAPVKGFRKREIARGAKHWLAPGAAVVTDGLGCWSALEEAACSHQAIRTGSGRQAARMASFKSVNTTLGNIKSAITGTYRKLGPDHAGRYLASFAWRYNPRYQLQTMIPRFVHSAARTQPMPYRLLIAG